MLRTGKHNILQHKHDVIPYDVTYVSRKKKNSTNDVIVNVLRGREGVTASTADVAIT